MDANKTKRKDVWPQKNADEADWFISVINVKVLTLRLGGKSSLPSAAVGRMLVHRNRQSAVCVIGQGHEGRVIAQGGKHDVHPRFHHLFGANRFVTLVLKEMTLEQGQCLVLLTKLRVNGGKVIRGRQ